MYLTKILRLELTDGEYNQIAQSCDCRTAVGLARSSSSKCLKSCFVITLNTLRIFTWSFFPGRTMLIFVSSSSQHLFHQDRRARRWSGWSRPWTILIILMPVIKVILSFRLMRDILASLPGAANSKELHQCIQLFTATALDQVGMMLMMLVDVIMMLVAPWWRWDWRSWR